jgi:uncharacterized YccA/Bax inhibitor family protein
MQKLKCSDCYKAFILSNMIEILSFLGIMIVMIICYFTGNSILKSFDDDWRERLFATFFGILFYIATSIVVVIFIGIYNAIRLDLLNAL